MDITTAHLTDEPVLGYRDGRRVWRFPDGAVVPYVAGGEGPLEMPAVPEDLATLTDEQVGGLEAELLGWFQARRPEARTADDVASLTRCAEHIEALRNLAADRYTAAAATATAEPDVSDALSALDGRLAGDPNAQGGEPAPATPPAAPPAPPADPPAPAGDAAVPPAAPPAAAPVGLDPALIAAIATQVGESVATAVTDRITAAAPAAAELVAPARVSPRLMNRYVPRDQDSAPAAPVGLFPAVVTAATTVPGHFEGGNPIEDARVLSEAMTTRWNQDRGKADTGAGERITIAHLVASAPEERYLRKGQEAQNTEKIAAYIDGYALTAAGGLCAPVTPLYDQPVIATAVRPFRAGFPSFMADRGGVRIVQPPTMADIVGTTPPDPNPTNLGDGVGTLTVSQDAAGVLKTCLDVPCHGSTEYDVEAIYRCLQFPVLGARVFPENVQAFNLLTAAVQAQKAETLLIDAVATVSHQLTFAKTFGTSRQMLAQLEHAAAQFRNVNRMDPDAVLQVRMPAWALNAMRADLTSSFHDDPELFSAADAMLEQFFADRNLAVGYYVDSGTGKGQLFAAVGNNGTAFPNFPTTVTTYMWAEGAFLFLDQGTLDIGIVRDSTLVAGNRFRDFSETWEGLAWTGLPSYELRHTISNDGSYGAALAIAAGAGSGL